MKIIYTANVCFIIPIQFFKYLSSTGMLFANQLKVMTKLLNPSSKSQVYKSGIFVTFFAFLIFLMGFVWDVHLPRNSGKFEKCKLTILEEISIELDFKFYSQTSTNTILT